MQACYKIYSVFLIVVLFCSSLQSNVLALIPNDPLYEKQWYLEAINAPAAWDLFLGSRTVTVAVIDTGIDRNHPDINFWRNNDEIPNDGIDNDSNGYKDDIYGWNFIENNNDIYPDLKNITEETKDIVHHGTIVAGIIAGIPNNREGISGVSWKAEIMPIKIARTSGVTTTTVMAEALRYAVDNGAEVINISLTSVDNIFDPTFQDGIEYAYGKNILVVAAVGNSNILVAPRGEHETAKAVYPACFYGDSGDRIVLGVGASDRVNNKASFSNYGSRCVEISAPGVEMISTLFYDPNSVDYKELYGGPWFGTSFSAPIVSGAAAYVRSINKNIDVKELMRLLKNTGDNFIVTDESFSNQLGSRLNLQKLIQAVLSGSTPIENKVVDVIKKEAPVPQHLVVLGSARPVTFYTAPYRLGVPEVIAYNDDLTEKSRFTAYNSWETDGVRVVRYYIPGGLPSIVTAPGPGAKPFIRFFTDGGILLREFLAYNESFKGGVQLAIANTDGVGFDEIVTVPESKGGPHVRIFDMDGVVKSQFFAHDKSYRGGLSIATGDINGDGLDEIIVGLGVGAEPLVKIFDYKGTLIKEFKAYESNFRGGISVSTGDVNGDGIIDIITGARQGGGPQVKIFSGEGALIREFFAYDKGFRGGILLQTVDIGQDGKTEIIVTPQGKGGPHVRIFDGGGNVVRQFFSYDRLFRGGVWIYGY